VWVNGRVRNSSTASSMSAQIRETVDFEIPESMPRALQATDQVIDFAGGYSVDVGLADDRVQGFVDPASGRQQRGEEGPVPQFRDVDVHIAGGGGDLLRPGAVTPVLAFAGAFAGAFVGGGADGGGGFGVDEVLEAGLHQFAVHVVVGDVGIVEEFLDERGYGRMGCGHRGHSSFVDSLGGTYRASRGGLHCARRR